MKKYLAIVLLAALPITTAVAAENIDKGDLTAEGKKIFMAFGSQLKGHLKGSLKSGGPTEAIDICNKVAPSIATDLSQKNNVELSRTSLKIRNAENSPDAWEKSVLLRFEERKANGEGIKTLAYSEIITKDGKQLFRMMAAIPTAEKPCLACHGKQLKPAISKKLAELYPADEARGFTAGDIRGAFTLKKWL